jgi:Neuraminidase (sialidase)
MRGLAFSALLLVHAVAAGGVLEQCQVQKKDADAVQLCVETEHLRSTNRLRKISAAARPAVYAKTKDDGHKANLREYRTVEARHVRQRKTLCRKQETSLLRHACEADMNYAHIEELARFTK